MHSEKADQNCYTTTLFPPFWKMYSIDLLNQIAVMIICNVQLLLPIEGKRTPSECWKAIWSDFSNSQYNKVAYLSNFKKICQERRL